MEQPKYQIRKQLTIEALEFPQISDGKETLLFAIFPFISGVPMIILEELKKIGKGIACSGRNSFRFLYRGNMCWL